MHDVGGGRDSLAELGSHGKFGGGGNDVPLFKCATLALHDSGAGSDARTVAGCRFLALWYKLHGLVAPLPICDTLGYFDRAFNMTASSLMCESEGCTQIVSAGARAAYKVYIVPRECL